MTSRPHRYRALAEALAEDLRAGRFPAGSRLPSVRQLCETHRASLATVTHALHELEDAGLIEARARQGFFARATPAPGPLPTGGVALALEARRERLMALAASRPDWLSLGHLALPPALLPLAALRRLTTQALQQDAALLGQGSVAGSEALRGQIARRAPRMGCAFAPEDLVVVQGESEALQLCLQLVARPGDVVAVASPAPLRALELMACLGLEVLEIPPQGGRQRWPAALARALRTRRVAACVIESGAGRADGAGLDDADHQALAALLARHALPLIECDMMGELYRGAYRPRPLKAFDADDRVLYCGSFACTAGPGLGLGYVASRRYGLRLRAARAVQGELLPALADRVLARFMAGEGYERHLRRLRKQLALQLRAYEQAVLRHFPAGTRLQVGEVGYALWVELPAGLDALALLARAREQGYSFVPGAVFSTGTAFDHCLRLSARHPLDEAHRRGIEVLGALACTLASTVACVNTAVAAPCGPRRAGRERKLATVRGSETAGC